MLESRPERQGIWSPQGGGAKGDGVGTQAPQSCRSKGKGREGLCWESAAGEHGRQSQPLPSMPRDPERPNGMEESRRASVKPGVGAAP